ncbi:ribokinase [Rhizobium sp. P32RR-XVIII]|uniref:ribokinase n=1 Tax=Rhizobium sp. P32RR-XVIII TaxID=2726738 RepID=UPI001456B790|nr:ribokinase [Rhizobium sp. P32RR-XVIII]NLS07367.1 ribokinase [Rhizobium sp. P32RR-XVIII]
MIIVLGSINIDLVTTTDRLPCPGETICGSQFYTSSGGKGANQALAARRAGSRVRMVGAVGTDQFGSSAISALQDAGIDLSAVSNSAAQTGTASIYVAADGENTIIVVPGANETIGRAEAAEAVQAMGEGDILMMQMELRPDAMEAAIRAAKDKGVQTMLNIAPMSERAADLATLVDIVVANETEFDLLVGKAITSPQERIELLKLQHEKQGQTIVVTLGSEGAIAIRSGEIFTAAGLRISPVDTVGAGDTFCGYLASSLDQGVDFGAALRKAAVAGSLACLARGAQAAIPYVPDVDARV